ncbi:hypothetical protein [Vibrio rotiferianus]|uniref:hypothetical protein n=1 Tax=Vibrio rotiferianus TaxID=190895 RepID=UPI0005EFBCF1|nr:hypothetical protein [Vibrio rotiferianus]
MLRTFIPLAIASISLIGCQTTQYDEAFRPAFFVKFSQGSSTLNNIFYIEEKLEQKIKLYEKEPTVVLVAYGVTAEEYSLALNRFYAISRNTQTDVRVLVKPIEKQEDKQLVAVHVVQEWNAKVRKAFDAQEFSEIPQLHNVYSGDDDRYFYRQPKARTIVLPKGNSGTQLVALGKQLGWKVDVSEMNQSLMKTVNLQRVAVNTLADNASSHEMKLIMKGVLDSWFENHSFTIDRHKKRIAIKEDRDAD